MYDVAVIGTGAMGSAACFHLAKAGAKVLGIDRHHVPHALGSSHAETRLIRQAYFEDPNYVPLLQRAYELWDELDVAADSIFKKTGLFVAGHPNRTIMQGIRSSAKEHRIPVEILDASEARSRYPNFAFSDSDACIVEPGAGYLDVDAALVAHMAGAKTFGAEILQGTSVLAISKTPNGFTVKTDCGDFHCKKLVLAAGAWIGKLQPKLAPHLIAHRVPLFWFEQNKSIQSPDVCYAFDLSEGFFYGFPSVDGKSIKTGLHKPGPVISDPSHFDRQITDNERQPVETFVRNRLKFCEPVIANETTCIYTMTADEHFLIDTFDDMVVLGACSGHGFKFSTVIGEIAKDLALNGKTSHPIGFLSMRF